MSTIDREVAGVGSRAPDPEGAVSIREVRPRDLKAVLAIEEASFTVPWTAATFRSLMNRRSTGMWVAEWCGEVVGYAVAWAVLDQAELGDVAVAAEHRRRGIATRLVDTVVAWLRDRGVRELFLEVRVSNHGAQRLYEREGFEPVGRRRGYYSRPGEDALVLRRTL